MKAASDDTDISVLALHIAPASRLPMKSVEAVQLTEGKGIAGDRYENSRRKHVTVQSQADLDAAAATLGLPIVPANTRRNITISQGALPTRPGQRLCIGPVELEVVRLSTPCRLLDDTIGDGANDALRGRAGTICRVLAGGEIRVGAPVRLLCGDAAD